MGDSQRAINGSSNNKELANMILFSIASCISLFGTSVYNFAIGLFVLKMTGSGLTFAITLALGILSTVLINPFAGVLADRLDKKLLVILTDMLNGLLLIGLYLMTIGYDLNLFMIYGSTFLLNVFTTVYGISSEAAKPNLVSGKRLMSLNSISKIIDSSSSILGPMVGGLVFAFLDIRFFILINGVSYIISGLLQIFMDFKFDDKDGKGRGVNFIHDIREGFNYLKDRKHLTNLFGVFIALNFFMGLSINVPMPYIINNVLQLDPTYYGIIQANFPVGMILGAIVINRVMGKYSYGQIIKSASILLSACMVAVGLSVILHDTVMNETVYLIYFILIMILAGIAISFIDIPIFYTLQQTIPDEFRGRVLSIGISMAKIILPVALIIAGALINLIPSYFLPIISGVLLCIFSIFYIQID